MSTASNTLITSMLEGIFRANPSKRSAPQLADASGSAKKSRQDAGPSTLQNNANSSTTGDELRILIKPVSVSMARISSTSSSALSTLEDTPRPTSAPLQRLRPIRFHTTSARGSASKSSQDSGPNTPQNLAASGLDVKMIGPYPPIAGHAYELQDGRCIKKEYRLAQKCLHCTGKGSKHGRIDCTFHGSRVFVVRTPPHNTIDADTPTFFCAFKPEIPMWNLRTRFYQKNNDVERDEIMKTVARGLHATLIKAEQHASIPNALLRNKRRNERRTCVYCMAPFFMSYWLCGECGRECCDDCCQAIKECLPSEGKSYVATNPNDALKLAREFGQHPPATPESSRSPGTLPSDTSPLSASDIRYEHDLSRLPPSDIIYNAKSDRLSDYPLLACGYGRLHGADSFVAVTTYSRSDLEALVKEADRIASNVRQPARNAPSHPEEIQGVHASITLDEATAWESQRPMLIAGVTDKFEVDWSPQSFSSAFAKVTCETQDCSSLQKRDVVVTDFFDQYGKFSKKRDGTWRIEDWPKTSDLATWQPDLYSDFIEHLPLPEYTRPDGIRNLASMIPLNVNEFDIGPKLLCAYKSLDQWNHGTVKLRTNAVDIVNVLVYASECENKPGEVLWTIWPPGSVSIIREHCYELVARQNSKPNKPSSVEKEKAAMDDPVYLQCLYLGPEARSELEKRGAKPWIIRQEAGQAVTVPAGCPYQVCNLSDCISVNLDFLSPESLQRCLGTLTEFQIQTRTQIWKEELLRLKSIAFYALRGSSSNLPSPTSKVRPFEVSRPAPSKRKSVAAAASGRPLKTQARRGRLPGTAPRPSKVTTTRSPSPPRNLYEQLPLSDVRSNSTATPARSPSIMTRSLPALSRSATPTAAPSQDSSVTSSVYPHEMTVFESVVDSAETKDPSIVDGDDMQLDADSPVISNRPLPKLRGRSPSEIEPVLKPSASSAVRTRPASSLREDQEAFYDSRKADPLLPAAIVSLPATPVTTSAPAITPITLPAATALLPAATIALDAAAVPLPAATIPPPASTTSLMAATIPLPVATIPPRPGNVSTAQSSGLPARNINSPKQAPAALDQAASARTQEHMQQGRTTALQKETPPPQAAVEVDRINPPKPNDVMQTPVELDPSVLDLFLYRLKEMCRATQELRPEDHRRLLIIAQEVLSYSQRSYRGPCTFFNQETQAYHSEIQTLLKATTSSFAKVAENAGNKASGAYYAALAELQRRCAMAGFSIFQCQKWDRVVEHQISKQDKATTTGTEQARRVNIPARAQLSPVNPREPPNGPTNQQLPQPAQRMPGSELVRSEETAGRGQTSSVVPVPAQRLSSTSIASSVAGPNDLMRSRLGSTIHPVAQRSLSPHAGPAVANLHPPRAASPMASVSARSAVSQSTRAPIASSSRPVSEAVLSRSNNSRYPPSSVNYGDVPYTTESPNERRALLNLGGQSLLSYYIARYG